MRTLVFGYSESPDRYSYMAAHLLQDYKHEVVTVNPRHESEFSKIKGEFHTLSLYVNPSISDKFKELLLGIKPKRVIFNPGTENPSLVKMFEDQGVEVVIGCTLVMLRTGQF